MHVLPITDPVLIVALVMGVVLLAPILVTRLRLPGLVGLLVAGVAIGPHGLNLLAREGTIEVLGTIGLLYIMFLAGLEVDLHEFARHRKQSVAFGLVTFALPQGLGTLIARFGLGFEWDSSVLLGSVFASHTLLAYPLVSRLGLAKQPAVTTSVGATLLTDTLALLVLAVIAGAERAGGFEPLALVRLLALLAVLVGGVVWGLPRLGRWFFRTVRAGEVADFGFVLFAVFAVAFLAELAGVEPIIGAFLGGLALNRLVPRTSPLMARVSFVGEALFIPFFLIATGMLVDLRVLTGGAAAWIVAGTMLATVVATKWLAAYAMRLAGRFTPDEAGVAFGLTIPQAAATLAAALVGFEVGLFSEAVLNGTVVMMLVTCILGPLAAARYGRRLALADAGAPETGARPQRIVVPLSNPETAEPLMDLALLLRRPDAHEPVYPLAVVRGGTDAEAQVAGAERLMERAVLHAAAADVPVVPTTRIDLSPSRGIAVAARELRASTVVIGWTGHTSTGALVFGTVLDQVLEGTRAMVAVSRLVHPLGTATRIVAAVPPQACRERGFDEAAQALKALAAQKGAEVVAVPVAEDAAAVERALKRARPAAPVRTAPVAQWAGVPAALEALARPTDLLVLLSVRRGALAWRPALDRLPRLLAARFPATDLLTLYLSEAEVGALVAEALTPGTDRDEAAGALALPPEQVTLGVEAADAAGALRRVLTPAFPDHPGRAARLAAALADAQGAGVPELRPGVVFFHCHTPEVEATTLLLGVSAGGLTLPRTSGPTHAVLVLLVPDRLPRPTYLRQLALVAQLVRGEGIVEALRAAETPEAARGVLLGGLRATPEAAATAPPPASEPPADGPTLPEPSPADEAAAEMAPPAEADDPAAPQPSDPAEPIQTP